MANRRRMAREAALQLLYLIEISQPADRRAAIQRYWEHDWREEGECRLCDEDCRDRDKPKSRFSIPVNLKADKSFSTELVNGVLAHQDEIDNRIESHSLNWKLQRMSFIDRNILRIAVFELLYCEEIPPKVSINEAIEIAKTYGDRNSPAFVNGILDQVK